VTEKWRVVVFDDDEDFRREWSERLGAVPSFLERFEALIVNETEFGQAIDGLRRRRAAARGVEKPSSDENLFDGIDVLIVDYDLFKLDETGEDVAYLARCFSSCGLIVAVNQYAREAFTFDLTLQGHPNSFADLNLLAEQISEPGLWGAQWGGFRPWSWPLLSRAIETRKRCISDVKGNLDCGILSFLEIPPEVVEIFPLEAIEFISAPSVTFRSFVLDSGQGLRGRGERPSSDESIARIAAARISKWLERLVLPGQNILVDAAHLVERYPSLLSGDASKRLVGSASGFELLVPDESVMDLKKLEPFIFGRADWLSRSAWYWPLVSECQEIIEVASPWTERQELAFCEDTSRIMPASDDIPVFVAKVQSPFVRRFASARHPRYGPQLQFAL